MKIIVYILFLIFISSNAFSECRDNLKVSIKPQIKKPEDEIKTSDLLWQDFSKVPKDAIKAIKKFYPYFESTSYSFFDLNNDGVDEIIFKNSDYSGSGGQGFSILEKQNGHWKEILQASGGFIINNLTTPKGYNRRYNTLTQWHRYGAHETVQYLLAYKNHKYQIVSDQPVPVTVLYSKDFQKMILDINWMCWDFWN